MAKRNIYFDYAASTPVDAAVLKSMLPYFLLRYGNPGSLHYFGQEAMAAVDSSREVVAKAVHADFSEIIFTGSATEANNLALRGVLKSYEERPIKKKGNKRPRIITSTIEHESVLDTVKSLTRECIEAIYLPVSREGFVDQKELKKALTKETVLVSIMLVNNEIGTIQPISAITEEIRKWKLENRSEKIPLFHTDAVQAFQYLDCNVRDLGVDLMTLSAHKIYGPKGVGALYVRGGAKNLRPSVTGGGQEFSLRSGTENVPNIVGFGKAVELAVKNRLKEKKRIREINDYFWRELKKIFPKAQLNGSLQDSLPNILNVYFPGQKSDDLLIKLDRLGIAVSSGSACSVRSSKPSHVLKALGYPIARIQGSLRFSFGKLTDRKEIQEALIRLKQTF